MHDTVTVTEQPPDYSKPPVAPPPAPAGDGGMEFVADKIGFVPNVRKSDNSFQAKFIGVSLLAGAGLFALLRLPDREVPIGACAGIGALAGLILGLLLSGAILAIKNLRR